MIVFHRKKDKSKSSKNTYYLDNNYGMRNIQELSGKNQYWLLYVYFHFFSFKYNIKKYIYHLYEDES